MAAGSQLPECAGRGEGKGRGQVGGAREPGGRGSGQAGGEGGGGRGRWRCCDRSPSVHGRGGGGC